MTNPELQVAVRGNLIIITHPATQFFAVYAKPNNRSELVLNRRPPLLSPTDKSVLPHAVPDEPCVTRLTTIAAMPASTALACGDDIMSMIGFDPGACP